MNEEEKTAALLSNDTTNLVGLLSEPHEPWMENLAVSHPQANAELLTLLSKSSDLEVVTQVIKHPKTPPQVLAELYSSQNNELYFELASNPNTPTVILKSIYHNPNASPFQVSRVLLNPNTSASLVSYHFYGIPVEGDPMELFFNRKHLETRVREYAETLFPGATEDLPWTWVEKIIKEYYSAGGS